MIDPISVAALIAGLLGISAKDIVPNVRRYLRTAWERGFEHKRASVRHHMLVETLKGYYGASLDSDPSPRFHFYEVEVGGKTPVRTSVVAKPEWVGLDLDLGSVPCALMPQPWTSGDGRVTPAGESTHGLDIWSPRITTEQAAKYSVLIASSGSEIYDQDLYRLENVGGFPQHLRVSFALDSYYRYRFGVGLLVEELTLALIEKNLNVEAVVRGKTDCLPLREYFLPNPSRFEDYQSRVCAGGIQVTCVLEKVRRAAKNKLGDKQKQEN